MCNVVVHLLNMSCITQSQTTMGHTECSANDATRHGNVQCQHLMVHIPELWFHLIAKQNNQGQYGKFVV